MGGNMKYISVLILVKLEGAAYPIFKTENKAAQDSNRFHYQRPLYLTDNMVPYNIIR